MLTHFRVFAVGSCVEIRLTSSVALHFNAATNSGVKNILLGEFYQTMTILNIVLLRLFKNFSEPIPLGRKEICMFKAERGEGYFYLNFNKMFGRWSRK